MSTTTAMRTTTTLPTLMAFARILSILYKPYKEASMIAKGKAILAKAKYQ
jgi:hypothetical protein